MKIATRPIRRDSLIVEQKGRRIVASTHRHTITFAAYSEKREQVAWHEFTFDQLYELLQDLKPGIAELMDKP